MTKHHERLGHNLLFCVEVIDLNGAWGRNRTGTVFLPRDFKSLIKHSHIRVKPVYTALHSFLSLSNAYTGRLSGSPASSLLYLSLGVGLIRGAGVSF